MDPPAVLTCWGTIDEATVVNGCVHVIPGSHRVPVEHRDRTEMQSRGILPAEVDVSRDVPVPLPAGGAMFHHSLLIHRSHPNSSPRYRRGLATIDLSANSRLTEPWDVTYGFRQLWGCSFSECI
jgi:ectoine hydroxylase-related dioxygenase (phytanoyl-CoA dioxygenase family)